MLTRLPNRRNFFEEASRKIPSPGGVLMMIDADHFKSVNDTYGHGVGDKCLVSIATLLRDQTRADDVIARLGGEEFAVLLVKANRKEAMLVADRLAKGVQLHAYDSAPAVRVTLSIGAVETAGRKSVNQLLSLADKALYEAKSSGRACTVFAKEVRTPSQLALDVVPLIN